MQGLRRKVWGMPSGQPALVSGISRWQRMTGEHRVLAISTGKILPRLSGRSNMRGMLSLRLFLRTMSCLQELLRYGGDLPPGLMSWEPKEIGGALCRERVYVVAEIVDVR